MYDRTSDERNFMTFRKASLLALTGLLFTTLLSACSSSDTVPAAESLTGETLNVIKANGQWLVRGGDQDAALLWRSQNPLGKSVSVKFADYDEPVDLTIKDDHAFLGDMIVGDVRDGQVIGAQGRAIANLDGSPLLGTQSFGIRSSGNRWPNAVVPYVYDGSATSNIRKQFEEARRIYSQQTGIRLVPRTNEAQYVRVQAGGGCSSYVGQMSRSFKPNGQELKLGSDGCGVGAALHEIGHAVGLEHEQTRCDRDDYIEVRYAYIEPDWQSQYKKNCDSNRTTYSAYDYKSIMHYRNAKKNGQWVMLARNGQIAPQDIGRNDNTLTSSDKKAFAAIYGEGGGSGNSSTSFEVRARGTRGGEKLNFRIDQTTLATFTLSKDYQTYQTSSNRSGVVNLEFFNDDGPSSDVQIDYIKVGSQTRQAEDQSYNTGAWGNGRCGGGSRTEMMQCNGVLGFGPVDWKPAN